METPILSFSQKQFHDKQALYRKNNSKDIKKRQTKWRHENKDKVRNWSIQWQKDNPKKVKEIQLLCRYGMTLKQYEEMRLGQKNRCAICKKKIKNSLC
jgi:hypothetical protein